MKNLDLRQFSEVMVALLAQKGISCRLGENNGRIGIIYEEAGIKASTDVTLLWQKYGADHDVTELADVLYKAITSEVQKKKAEMPNPKPEQQVQPQISRPQMRTQPGRVTQQPMPDDMGGKMQIKCFNGIPGQNCAPLFEGSFDSPEEAKAAIAGFMKNVLNADDASVAELMKEFDARTRGAEAPKQHVKKPEPGDTARLAKKMFNMSDDEANDFLANLLKADLERQERQSAYNQPAPASEPRKNTSKYTRNDVAEAEKAAKGLIKNLFGIDLPEDMHSTVYNMAADDKTGDKTDAWLLLDGVDSGFSIDAIEDLKRGLFDTIFEMYPDKEIYIIVSANEYEMARGEMCFDVVNCRYVNIKSYDRSVLSSKTKHDVSRGIIA